LSVDQECVSQSRHQGVAGGNMAKVQPVSPGVGSTIARLWWVVVFAALIGGAASFAASDRSTTERIYGVVNMRPVATLANDRVDLVEDLDVALTLPSVLSGPAQDAGMSVSQLRKDLTVQPLGQTSFVRVGVVVHDGDDAVAEQVLRSVVDSAATFMSGGAAEQAIDDPLTVKLRFVSQREDALEYELSTTPANSDAHEELVSEREAARAHRQAVQERLALQADALADREVVLPLTLEGRDLTRGGSDTQVRRAAAGAAVGGLIAGVAIAAIQVSGRRRTR